MTKILQFIVLSLILILLGGCRSMEPKIDITAEKEAISKVIHSNIGWAATKDKDLLFSTIAQDSDLFWFSPRDDGTVSGFESFVAVTEGFFMNDDFKAVRYEIKDLTINISRSGDVAWYHARLDDYNTWKGQPANWEDVRWTGVLEKRDGHWLIVQMHFSAPTDRK